MPEDNLFAVFLSTKFFGFLSLMMKKVDGARARVALEVQAAWLDDRPDAGAKRGVTGARRRACVIHEGLVLKIAFGRRMMAATHNHPEW
jgi:hypothetical protein